MINGSAPHLADIHAWMGMAAPNAQLSANSRTIAAGDLFFAYAAVPDDPQSDGRTYIADAIARGAVAVLYDPEDFVWDSSWSVPHYAVVNLKTLAGDIANLYYRNPDHGMFTVAVTGTNGKTSCASWLGNILSNLYESAGVIGTLGVALLRHGQGKFIANGYTTPDAVLLQRTLSALRDDGVAALAMEASSIGLDQGRMNGMHVDVALFTNFSRDHLDYHVDMAAYEAAKTRLFVWPGLQHAVINLDDPLGRRLIQRLKNKASNTSVLGYTLLHEEPAVPSLKASQIRTRPGGTEFHLDSPYGSASIKTHLIGYFNVSNVLGVLGVLLAKGVPFRTAIKLIEDLQPAPGRMQQLGGQDAPLIIIDYAHTPDALEKAVATLRQVATERSGQLWCIFGCGGNRDAGKRPQMGAIAELADHVIVTSDNSRNEDPYQIIDQIVKGMKNKPQIIEDRAAAILSAVKHADKNDVILLAGKGHEAYQEINGKQLPFSDADHAALALAARATMKRMA